MHEMIKAEPFSEEILEKAAELRKIFDIPAALDSPFFIARFLSANNGNVDVAKERLLEYLIHRSCLRYGEYDQLGIFNEIPIGKETFERFNISLVEQNLVSNNVHVFVQKLEGTDLNQIIKVLPLSHVIHSYFLLQDVFGRVVANTEKKTGKPSSVVCILDLQGLNISEFINPLSPQVKLAKTVVKVWADYFSENMCKILIINPPGIVSLMWKITKFIMDPRTLSRISFLNSPEDLKLYLEPQVIPQQYGGTWVDNSGYSKPAEGCCREPLAVLPAHLKQSDYIWRDNGYVQPPASKSLNVKGRETLEIIKKSASPGKLLWSFTSSGDINFEILKRESGKEKHVWPKITIASLKLPESGSVDVDEGEYIIRFTNPGSTWFPVKIHCSSDIKPE
ncbi:unnamed protein product [Auanema sp. JU1783]|nr:unnamed protein product [Auanema sp. JU1783]